VILGGVEKLYLLIRRLGIEDSISESVILETLDLLGRGVSPRTTTEPEFTWFVVLSFFCSETVDLFLTSLLVILNLYCSLVFGAYFS
jgi:hypothetical protein